MTDLTIELGTILVVEDEPDLRDLLQLQLGLDGYCVHVTGLVWGS